MTQISILGCGWLGLPLAKTLIGKGFQVKGSTTSTEKMALLQDSGIVPYSILLGADGFQGDLSGFLDGSNVLIIDIPPKAKTEGDFTQKIKILLPEIQKSGIKKVLFISSTSVYADDNSIITESNPPNPDSESGQQLVHSEQLLWDNPDFKTTILRFAGLIGENRHPVHFLAGRKNTDNPDGPVNLIHQKDCIGIIVKILELDIWGETFNAAAPYHPTRRDYYTQKALSLQLALPEFNPEKASVGKTIDSSKLIAKLDYQFEMTSL